MLAVLISLKLIAEIALCALAGQWLLGLLSALMGVARERNPVYKVLQLAGRPFVQTTRALTPRWVQDQHVPPLAFALLIFVWVAVTFGKIQHCVEIGVSRCQ